MWCAAPRLHRPNLDTALIPRESAVLFRQEPVGLAMAAASAIAQTLLDEKAREGTDPFSRRDGWRFSRRQRKGVSNLNSRASRPRPS